MIATRKPSCQFQEEEEEEEAGFWRVSQAPPLPDRMSLSEGSNPPWNELTPTVGEITRVTMETLSPLICYNIWQKHKARVYLKDFPCTFAEDCAGKDVPWALAFRVTSQRRQDNHLNRVDNLWNKRGFMKLFWFFSLNRFVFFILFGSLLITWGILIRQRWINVCDSKRC